MKLRCRLFGHKWCDCVRPIHCARGDADLPDTVTTLPGGRKG